MKVFVIFLIAIFLVVNASFAEKKSALAELTKEEILERIKHMLEVSPETADFIPELKDMDLEGLDKETLMKIHARINTERTRIQTERIQKQLQAVRAAQNIPKAPTPPPSPPKIPTPPPQPPVAQRR